MQPSRHSRLLPIEVEFPPEAFALMRTAMEVSHRLTAAGKADKALKCRGGGPRSGMSGAKDLSWVGYKPLKAVTAYYTRPTLTPNPAAQAAAMAARAVRLQLELTR